MSSLPSSTTLPLRRSGRATTRVNYEELAGLDSSSIQGPPQSPSHSPATVMGTTSRKRGRVDVGDEDYELESGDEAFGSQAGPSQHISGPSTSNVAPASSAPDNAILQRNRVNDLEGGVATSSRRARAPKKDPPPKKVRKTAPSWEDIPQRDEKDTQCLLLAKLPLEVLDKVCLT